MLDRSLRKRTRQCFACCGGLSVADVKLHEHGSAGDRFCIRGASHRYLRCQLTGPSDRNGLHDVS